MMNRERALQWLVDNIKEWPETIPTLYEGVLISGWKFIYTNMAVKFISHNGQYNWLTNQDWQAAQPAPASNKPSWDDAPEDANWLCQDASGEWWFSTSKINPYVYKGVSWKNQNDFVNEWCEKSYEDTPNPNWRDTLEYRPEVKDYSAIKDLTKEQKESASQFIDDVIDRDKKESDALQYVPKNLARIKQLNDEIELAQLSIESMKTELAERNKEVKDVLNYCKFNA